MGNDGRLSLVTVLARTDALMENSPMPLYLIRDHASIKRTATPCPKLGGGGPDCPYCWANWRYNAGWRNHSWPDGTNYNYSVYKDADMIRRSTVEKSDTVVGEMPDAAFGKSYPLVTGKSVV